MRKRLRVLKEDEYFGDVKQFIRGSHDFYKNKNPEMKVLADKLKKEYVLEDFYNVFNKLWKSGYPNERVLAVSALKLYDQEYDDKTWNFLIPRLREVKDLDEAEIIGRIIGKVAMKYPELKKEIIKIGRKKNVYYRIMALASCYSLVKIREWDYVIYLVEKRLYDSEDSVQELNGRLLMKIASKSKKKISDFVRKNIDMPKITLDIIGSEFDELKKIRKLKKLESESKGIGWLKIIG